ncbi:hypothetical protein CL6EHI_c00106 [Entamoeba histolytica]|uniref:Uncharacterized protein n=1 Tax=Entamoeba histolytica TaxID=5759 RepID=A0A175JNZ7_ENTHI|nr:hypothetical protein CL6EHI_c00106 [Entamoeba histolytica]
MSNPLVKITLNNSVNSSSETILDNKIDGPITIEQTMQAVLDAQNIVNFKLTEILKQNK